MIKMGYTPEEIVEMAKTQGYEELSKAVKRLGVSAIEGIDAQDDVIARCINALIDRIETSIRNYQRQNEHHIY